MFKGKTIFTIIPARGGSKSLPRKNIRLFKGKPLVAYSIDYSKKCRFIDRTIVSTDDAEIARISRKYGAETPFLRPKKYAQDSTQDFPVFIHAANWLKKNENIVPNFFVLLRPTSPLRPEGLIEKGIKLLVANPTANSVRTVRLLDEIKPYRIFSLNGKYINQIVDKVIKEPYNIPRQNHPNFYYQTGVLEIVRSSTVLKKRSVSGDKILPLIMEKKDVVDIDTLDDFNKLKKIKY